MKIPNQIDNLELQVEKLRISFDSIKNAQNLHDINYKINEHLNIVKDVNEFYDSAWTKLIFLITILGIFVPFVIQYFQRLSNKEIFKKYSTDFDAKMELLKEENRKNFENLTALHNQEMADLRQANETSTDELYGSTYFLQGRVRYTENNFRYAFYDFIKAANRFFKIDKSKNVNVSLAFLRNVISKLETKKEFEEVLKIHEINWDIFLAKFSSEDKIEDYTEKITELKSVIDKLK